MPGNSGRLLDARRTPVRIVDIRTGTGFFVLRIEGFEDEGAEWEMPFETVDQCQFLCGSERTSEEDVAGYRATIERLDRPLEVEPDVEALDSTRGRLEEARDVARAWLAEHSEVLATGARLPDPSSRRGPGPPAAGWLPRWSW